MSVCVPVKELKNTANFARIVEESPEPVIVTRNGYDSFAVMTMEQYESLRMEAARARLYREVDMAMADVEDGNLSSHDESMRKVRERYGL